MKKSLFILATFCFCSNGFPQTIKNNQAEYEKDILNKGASKPFLSDFSDWRKFRNNEELNEEVSSTGSISTTTSPPPTTPPPTTPPPTTPPPTTPPPTTPPPPPTTTTSPPPPTTTPKNGAVTLSSTSFSTFSILLLVHSVCRYIYR